VPAKKNYRSQLFCSHEKGSKIISASLLVFEEIKLRFKTSKGNAFYKPPLENNEHDYQRSGSQHGGCHKPVVSREVLPGQGGYSYR
jgi:hypothetical protein